MDKKHQQLGMNASTASARLVKDILFMYVVSSGQVCYRCGGKLDRATFSIEHITPWLDSEDPVRLFFDLDNIGFSHLRCNVEARRIKYSKAPHGTNAKYKTGCKCENCKKAHAIYKRSIYSSDKRREKYKNKGY